MDVDHGEVNVAPLVRPWAQGSSRSHAGAWRLTRLRYCFPVLCRRWRRGSCWIWRIWPSPRAATLWPTSAASSQTGRFASSGRVTRRFTCRRSKPSPLQRTRFAYSRPFAAAERSSRSAWLLVLPGAGRRGQVAQVRTGCVRRLQDAESHSEQAVQDRHGDGREPAHLCTHGELAKVKSSPFSRVGFP